MTQEHEQPSCSDSLTALNTATTHTALEHLQSSASGYTTIAKHWEICLHLCKQSQIIAQLFLSVPLFLVNKKGTKRKLVSSKSPFSALTLCDVADILLYRWKVF